MFRLFWLSLTVLVLYLEFKSGGNEDVDEQRKNKSGTRKGIG